MRNTRPPLFDGLPTEGLWTALALTRAQFFAVLGLSLLLFLFVDGPVWRHVHAAHFRRITVSYALIPIAVTAALLWNGTARPLQIAGASAVMALVKLVLTAALLVALALAEG